MVEARGELRVGSQLGLEPALRHLEHVAGAERRDGRAGRPRAEQRHLAHDLAHVEPGQLDARTLDRELAVDDDEQRLDRLAFLDQPAARVERAQRAGLEQPLQIRILQLAKDVEDLAHATSLSPRGEAPRASAAMISGARASGLNPTWPALPGPTRPGPRQRLHPRRTRSSDVEGPDSRRPGDPRGPRTAAPRTARGPWRSTRAPGRPAGWPRSARGAAPLRGPRARRGAWRAPGARPGAPSPTKPARRARAAAGGARAARRARRAGAQARRPRWPRAPYRALPRPAARAGS